MQRVRLRLRTWLLASCLACLASPALAHGVCVVSSDKTQAFEQASDSLVQALRRGGLARTEIQLLSVSDFVEGNPHCAESRLVVALGADALRQVVARNTRTGVIAGLIPRLSYERLLQEVGRKNLSNMTALYLDQPFGRQLDLLHLALPSVHRIGVLWGPESLSQQPLLAVAAQARGMELVEGLYAENQSLISALRSALSTADVLLSVADSRAFNASTASNILLTSYRARTPVMAFSPAYVKAGALLSLHSTSTQVGTQLAAMVAQFLQSNTLPASQYPLEFSISANAYVARSLGLSLDVGLLSERLHQLEKKP
jgi:ABC-type uncharacterized transport system substrate-binding protein